jgi:hypothetical protein
MKNYTSPEAMVLAFEAKDIMVSSNENELVPDEVLPDSSLMIQDIQNI